MLWLLLFNRIGVSLASVLPLTINVGKLDRRRTLVDFESPFLSYRVSLHIITILSVIHSLWVLCTIINIVFCIRINHFLTKPNDRMIQPVRLSTTYRITSTNIAIPLAKCQMIWQWKSQTPGLSARKRSTAYPRLGICVVSRRVALVRSYGDVVLSLWGLLACTVVCSESESESVSVSELKLGGFGWLGSKGL